LRAILRWRTFSRQSALTERHAQLGEGNFIMPYVSRDENGNIVGIFRSPIGGASEELAAEDPEVIQFLSDGGSSEQLKWELFVSDLLMGRLIEDLVDVLIQRSVMTITDLPAGAQRKLMRRRHLRDKMQAADGLLTDEGGVL
jgi:hypothetical protein